MKRMTAILLSVILLLSCFPLITPAAKTVASVETKFRLLLEDLELVGNIHQSDRYFYEELGQYPAKNPQWVLISGGLYDLSAKNNINYQYASYGNKLLRANVNSTPFKLGYGVYDVKSGAFYDLVDAWNMNLNNLREVWDELTPTTAYSAKDKSAENGMFVIGDADTDGEVTILDATRIQRCLADLEDNPWEQFAPTGDDFIRGAAIAGATDYDRDGDTTIMDATRIQRGLAELPTAIDAKIVSEIKSKADEETAGKLLTSRKELEAFAVNYIDKKKIPADYDDDYFKTHALVGAFFVLGGNYPITLKSAVLDPDGTLNVDFTYTSLVPVSAVESPRFVLVEISNAFIDDIGNVRVNTEFIEPYKGPVDAKLVWQTDKISEMSMEDESTAIIRSRTLLEYYARDYIEIGDLPKQFSDAYFKSHTLVGAFFQLEKNYQLRLKNAEIVEDGILNVNFTYTADAPASPSKLSPCFVLVEIPNTYNDDIRYAVANREYLTRSIYNDNIDLYQAASIPADFAAQGYTKVAFEKGSSSVISVADRDVTSEFLTNARKGNDDDDPPGVAAIIYTPEDLEYVIRDGKTTYDQAFFEDYALAAIIHHWANYEPELIVNGLYKKDGILYIDAEIIDDECPPMPSDVCTLVKVKRSDLEGVTAVTVGKNAANTVVAKLPNANKISVMPDNPATQGYQSIDTTTTTPSGAFNDWNGALPDPGWDDGRGYVLLIRNKSELKKYLPDFDKEGKYNDTYFFHYSIVAFVGQGGESHDTAALDDIAVKGDTLYANARIESHLQTINGQPVAEPTAPYVWTFRQVKKGDVAAVKAISFWKKTVTMAVVGELPRWNQLPEIPDDPAGQGYQSVTAKTVTMSAPAWNDLGWGGALPNPEGKGNMGYVLLLRSKADLKKYLPDFDKEGKYDDAYFENNSLVALLAQGNDFNDTAELDSLMIKNGTLYADAYVASHYATDDDGNEIAEPAAPVVWTIRQVKKSDVAAVNAIQCWTQPYPSIGANIGYFSQIENYPAVGDFSETNEAYLLTDAGDVAPALGKLYAGADESLPTGADDVSSMLTKRNYYEQHVIAMRVFQGSSDTKISVDRVWRSSRTELTVEVTRTFPDSGAVTPDMNWRFIYLAIPNYGKHFTVKVNTTVVEPADDPFEISASFADKDHMYTKPRVNVTSTGGSNLTYCYTLTSPVMEYGSETNDFGAFHIATENDPEYREMKPGMLQITTGYISSPTVDMPTRSLIKNNGYTLEVRAKSASGRTSDTVSLTFNNRDLKSLPMVRELRPASDRKPMSTVITGAGSFSPLEAKAVTVSSPATDTDSYHDFYLDDSSEGYVILIRNRIEFLVYFPGFDQEGKLDDTFFSDHCLIAILAKGKGKSASASIDDLAVVGDSFYVNPSVSGGGSSSAPPKMIWSFMQIEKQRFTENPNTFGLWTKAGVFNDLKYDINKDSEVSIVDYLGSAQELTIPSAIDGLPVKNICFKAFINRECLKKVTIPNTVTYLGGCAFSDCTELESISLPDSITEMGASVFFGCTSLTHVDLPKKLDSVPSQAFTSCTKLTSIGYPDAPVYIGVGAFTGCTALTQIDIPATVTSINQSAFSGCSALESINLPAGLTMIGNDAFRDCKKLQSITIPAGVEKLGEDVFLRCTGLKSVSLPEGLATIDAYAFSNCTSLPSIRIPEAVSSIGTSAFEKCTALTTLSIPRGVKTIGPRAAKNCTSLKAVYIASEFYPTYVGVEIPPIETETIRESAFEGCTALTTVAMPDGIKTIGSRAFYGCTALDYIDLPSTVTAISEYTFMNCKGLITVHQMHSDLSGNRDLTVKTVGENAFRDCKSLKNIGFGDKLTSIGEGAFRGCTSLSSLDLKENLKTISSYAFFSCDSLKKLTIPKSVTAIDRFALGYTLGKDNAAVRCPDFTIRGYLGTIAAFYASYYYGFPFEPIIEDNELAFTLIDDYSPDIFFGDEEPLGIHVSCQYRTAEAVKELYTVNGEEFSRGDKTFAAENFNIYGNKDLIALRVFKGGSVSQVMPDKVTITGDGEITVDVKRWLPAGMNDTPDMRWSILFLAIPKLGSRYTVKVNVNNDNNYKNYNGLEYFIYGDGEDKSVSIVGYTGLSENIAIPETIEGYPVLTVGYQAFLNNKTVKTVTLPNGLDYLYPEAFKGCTSLNTVYLPPTLRLIDTDVFRNCTSLRYVYRHPEGYYVKPTEASYIFSGAFAGCTSLESIDMPENLKQINKEAFLDCTNLKEITIPKTVEQIGEKAVGYDKDGKKLTNFYVFGYSGTAAEQYAKDNGFTFKKLDNVGYLKFNTEEIHEIPSGITGLIRDNAAYFTNDKEGLEALLRFCYMSENGPDPERDQDPYHYVVEDYDDAWFETHDVIVLKLWNYYEEAEALVYSVERDPDDHLIVTAAFMTDDKSKTKNNHFYIAVIGIEKQDYIPDVEVNVVVEVGVPAPEKPILYLYPEEETELTVTLGKPEELTCTYPAYNDGWHVTAKPDGTLVDDSGRSYYSLYWESRSSEPVAMNDGFVVKGEDTAAFLEEKLAILGLNEREAQEFIIYWLPKMQNNRYNLIRFADKDEIERIMPLSFSVQPDSVIRVLMEYKPLDEAIEIPEQKLVTPERRGFTAVEWGGTLIG